MKRINCFNLLNHDFGIVIALFYDQVRISLDTRVNLLIGIKIYK